jgi:hypothetical protein
VPDKGPWACHSVFLTANLGGDPLEVHRPRGLAPAEHLREDPHGVSEPREIGRSPCSNAADDWWKEWGATIARTPVGDDHAL